MTRSAWGPAWLGIVLAAGCTEAPPVPDPDAGPLAVEFVGCSRVGTGPTCRRKEASALTLWVPTSRPPFLALDGDELATTWEPVLDGFRTTVVPDGGALLEVLTQDGGIWSFPLESWAMPPDVAQARALGGQPSLDALAQIADTRDGEPRAEALWILGSLGAEGYAFDRLESAAREDGLWWFAALAALRQADAQLYGRGSLGALARAAEHVDRLGGHGEHRVEHFLATARAIVSTNFGDHRGALQAVGEAERRAIHLDRTDEAERAQARRALSLIRVGQVDDAMAVLQAQADGLSFDHDPCRDAYVACGLAAGLLLAREWSGTDVDPSEVLDHLDRAIDVFDSDSCSETYKPSANLVTAHQSSAVLSTWIADYDRAEEHLRALTRLGGPPSGWVFEVRARILRHRGNLLGALAAYDEMAEVAGADTPELEWRAHARRGDLLVELGRHAEAISAYQRASQVVFDYGLALPIHMGRADFYAQRRDATAQLAELLLDDDRAVQAFDALRTSRSAYLHSVFEQARLGHGGELSQDWFDAQDEFRSIKSRLDAMPPRWQLPTEERSMRDAVASDLKDQADDAMDRAYAAFGMRLEPTRTRPNDGEVLVGWFQGVGDWLGFAEDADGVMLHRWPGEAAPPVDQLLVPFAAKLATARYVTLFPEGSLAETPIQAAPFREEPLVAQMPVRESMDLVGRPPSALPEAGQALVVSDPEGNLTQARREGVLVQSALAEGGWTITALAGPDATRQRVVELLPHVALFHYSGHADAEPGWGSRLGLAVGWLDVGDVVALSSVPAIVVLNACDTARETDRGALGLAQAFLTKGSRAVVATSEPVDDTVALQFAQALYRHLLSGEPTTEAYRRAILELQARRSDATWRNFRLLQG